MGWVVLSGLFYLFVAALVALPSAAQPDTAAESSSSGEITVTCKSFGVGGVARPGDWVGVKLNIKDSTDRQREVIVRFLLTDADGDKPLPERSLTTNPGVNQPLWVYFRLPATFRQGVVLTVNAYQSVEQAAAGAGDPTRWGFASGRLLGTTRITPNLVITRGEGLLGILSSKTLGLAKYAGAPGRTDLPTGHERTQIVDRLTVDSLPDRWYGLIPFDVLVWNEPKPSDLTSDQAQAIREWVQRGGHLVVVLPRVGQTWTDEPTNPLYDITPRVQVKRREGIDLKPYSNLIAKDPAALMPTSEVLQVFTPLDGATFDEASCILAGLETGPAPSESTPPPREWLVARRLAGTGMVDLVGLDVASSWMAAHGLPDPEPFWHRVLGRRGELWNVGDFASGDYNLRVQRPDVPTTVDRDIVGSINMGEAASVGVLMGFVVFILYWLVAGPLGYAALKKTGRIRHAWLGFVAAAGLFTAFAWGGATAIRPAKLKAKHFTILDHVYGQNIERARSFVSLLVPIYGEATVAVGDPSLRAATNFHNIITPWDGDSAPGAGFPDARGYRVDSKTPDQLTVPTRSTVKQFQVDWAGGPRYRMPQPQPVAGQAGEPRLWIDESGSRPVIHGILTHGLPAPLKNVTIIVVRSQKDLLRSLYNKQTKAPLLSDVYAFTMPNSWAPGEALDLSATVGTLSGTGAANASISGGEKYLETITASLGRTDQGDVSVTDSGSWTRLVAMSLFSQLDPPEIKPENSRGGSYENRRWAQRRATHGYDLSPWFTQPCIIILGHLDGGDAAPVPLMVSSGGAFREVAVDPGSFTMVRWVYPLAANPPAFPKQEPNTPAKEGNDKDSKGGPL